MVIGCFDGHKIESRPRPKLATLTRNIKTATYMSDVFSAIHNLTLSNLFASMGFILLLLSIEYPALNSETRFNRFTRIFHGSVSWHIYLLRGLVRDAHNFSENFFAEALNFRKLWRIPNHPVRV